MSKLQINTASLWDIGKEFELIQHQIDSLSDSLISRASSLNIVEDLLQWFDNRIKDEARKDMRSQANRCGLAASYLFKMAEGYEGAESVISGKLAAISAAIGNVRSGNDEIYAEHFKLTDEEKYQKAIDMGYSQQNSVEAENIPYPGGDRGKKSTAKTSACGSFAMLHALRYLSKSKKLSIQEICAIAVESGARPSGKEGGTNIPKLVDALKEREYDITLEECNDYKSAIESLKEGQVIISSFPGNRFHNWGEGGHFVLIADISEDGSQVLIVDSDTRNLKYDDNNDGIYWVPIEKIQYPNSRYVIS